MVNVGDGRSVSDVLPDDELWQKTWSSNFESALKTARTFLPMLEKSKGCFLFVSSIAGLEAFGAPTDYSTAKTAIIALAKNMARKLAPNVRVNVIAPGNVYFKGGSWDGKIQQDKKRVDEIIKSTVPMDRFATPQEVADSAVFLCSDKASFITGATGLLGKKYAEAVACYGGTPILLDLSQQSVDYLANELNEKYKVDSVGFEIDITNEEKIENNAKQLIEKFGRIDGLVNNAANNPKVEDSSKVNFSRLENFPIDTWNDDLSVGLTGSFLCAKHYGHKIAQNSNGGSIVNISSDLGLIAPDQRLYKKDNVDDNLQNVKPVTYSVVKTGLIGLTRYLATYWADKGVRCNVMCPGGVENGQPIDFLKEVNARIPMGRMAKSDEYQGTLIWMLSDASSYLNGSIVPVDGGRTVW